MHDCIIRVPGDHAGPGIPHHLPDLLPHIPLVTVNRAGRTNRLIVSKPAIFSLLQGILLQRAAGVAQIIPRPMRSCTIDPDHEGYSPLLPFYSLLHLPVKKDVSTLNKNSLFSVICVNPCRICSTVCTKTDSEKRSSVSCMINLLIPSSVISG